jgi:CRP-like cAMP-binding protein
MINLLHLFANEEQTVTFAAGQPIFEIGDEGREMYVVLSGRVDVILGNTVVETIGPGGIFGELALLNASPRSASIVAHDDCRVFPINEERFYSLVQEHPDFSLHVMNIMAERLRRQT